MKRQRSTIRKKRMRKGIIVTVMTVLSLSSCALPKISVLNSPIMEEQQVNSQGSEQVDIGFVTRSPESYDSADTPVVTDIDTTKKTITFLNLDIGKRYTLSLDGTSKLYDKYGEGISLEQVKLGDIVDVTFLKSEKHLNSLQPSSNAWSYGNVERYEMNTVRNEVTIGDEVFKLADNALYLSGTRPIEKMDLDAMDVLTFRGIDNTILSVSVDNGHGYLRLINDENFVGGWIEIGQQQIQRITDDMLLTVPEGSYEVYISHNGGGGTKSVVINRNEETVLDIGDLTVAEAKQGMVLFSLTPADATLYIDGSEVDASKPVILNYGIHQIIAKADGYKALTQYIRVGQESAGLDVILDKADSNGTDSSASSQDATTNYYRIFVDAPEGAEVYLDNKYMGVTPCSFPKASGSHEITLRKSGYESKTYKVEIDDEQKDVSYSFANLIKSSTSVSSNDLVNVQNGNKN